MLGVWYDMDNPKIHVRLYGLCEIMLNFCSIEIPKIDKTLFPVLGSKQTTFWRRKKHWWVE